MNFSKSDVYRNRIHNLIPGGAHTYSKGDDQFPARAPAAISHGAGCHVWDIDGNKFLDCSMGLTSVSLGHAYKPVLERVKAELDRGVNFQRPSIIEMEMAEKFLSLVPQHDMIKFAKNGSTATTAAVKLARAATGRKLVAFPSDQPFFSFDDWFIGKTACNMGVPEEFAELSVTFDSYNLQSLHDLFNRYPDQIACVITEPEKSQSVPDNYLADAIALTHKFGALFIADEMITGFKTAFPGTITKLGVEPDLATWGKGVANGFSFCALTGKKEVMEYGGIRNEGREKVFLISSTHGGETHSIAAGLATIAAFEKDGVISHNQRQGENLIALCRKAVVQRGLDQFIDVADCSWMPVFTFKNTNGVADNGLRSLMLQEMIQRGVLFQGIFSPCFSHRDEDINHFAEALYDSLGIYEQAIEKGWEALLLGNPTKPVFRKYL